MDLFFIALTSGLSVGCISGLIALSLCVIYNASVVVNFSQGHIAMLGALAGYLFIFTGAFPTWVGVVMIIALPLVGAIGEHYLLTEPPLRKRLPMLNPILALLGGALIIEGSVGISTKFQYFTTHHIFGWKSVGFGFIRLMPQYLAIIIGTGVLTILYWLLLNKTYLGLALRSTGIDPETASIMGVNLSRIRLLSWVISAVVSGIAGFLIAPLEMVRATSGFSWLINGFIAAVFGGFGRPFASVGGGIVIGLITSFFACYVSSGHAMLIMFSVMLAILAFRPQGLFVR